MAKVIITCPFSNGACIECGVYRGRHFSLCSVKGHRGKEWDSSRHPGTESEKTQESQKKAGSRVAPKIIFDVENFIEAEEFSIFRGKGEEHDT